MPVSNTYDGLSGHTNNQIAKEKKVASHGSLLTKSNGEDRSFVKMMGKGFEKIKAKTTPAPGPVETRVFDSNSGSYCSHNRPGSFAPNDRFVFVDVNKQVHRGLVKYTGIFPQSHLENYIGVEFDEPIGKGDGICSGKQMFNSKDNHAGLIHASMCKKELEYERDLKEVVKTSHNIDQIRLSPKIDKGETVMINHLGYNFIGRVITHFYNSSNINSKWVVCQLLNAKVPENWKKLDNKDRPFCPDSAIHMLEAKPDQCTIVPLDCISPYIEVLTNGNSSMKAEPITSLPSYSANNLSYAPNNSNYGSNYLPPSYADSQRSTPQVQSYNGNGHLKNFGSIDSGIEDRPAMPCRDFDALYGKMKGIQGHNNSCYLDATLYTMFLQSNIFDDLILNKKRDADDIPEFEEAQRILKSEIVYPLRKFHFVRADHVLKLRILLGKVLNDQVGMTSDEKDPEEFMTALFEKVFKVKPLLRLQNMSDNKAHDTYLCPLIADDAWTPRQLQLMNLQYLFDRSMYSSSVEFANIPKVLIVQLPRSAEQKVFDRILPTMTLDISSFLHNTVRPCGFCRKAPAKLKCNECFLTKESYMKDVTFCQNCFDKCHTDNEAHRHVPTIINSNSGQSPSNVLLKLSGVLCIETSHYVTFVNCNVNSATPETDKFVFFDSMADREGTTDGYNIPKVEPIPDVAKWLTADGACRLSSIIQDYGTLSDKSPEYHPKIKRLLNDCYICIYQYVDELNYNDANCMYGRTTSRV
uniref:USP domain-containing protein n=1 Tax=Rhabditophanes sp. KR3021 TaxID=114890 RepID=A0AC35TNZ5_9BILA